MSSDPSTRASDHDYFPRLRQRGRLRADGRVYVAIDLLGEGICRGELVGVAGHFGSRQ